VIWGIMERSRTVVQKSKVDSAKLTLVPHLPLQTTSSPPAGWAELRAAPPTVGFNGMGWARRHDAAGAALVKRRMAGQQAGCSLGLEGLQRGALDMYAAFVRVPHTAAFHAVSALLLPLPPCRHNRQHAASCKSR